MHGVHVGFKFIVNTLPVNPEDVLKRRSIYKQVVSCAPCMDAGRARCCQFAKPTVKTSCSQYTFSFPLAFSMKTILSFFSPYLLTKIEEKTLLSRD